jgi:hypothetical protein
VIAMGLLKDEQGVANFFNVGPATRLKAMAIAKDTIECHNVWILGGLMNQGDKFVDGHLNGLVITPRTTLWPKSDPNILGQSGWTRIWIKDVKGFLEHGGMAGICSQSEVGFVVCRLLRNCFSD